MFVRAYDPCTSCSVHYNPVFSCQSGGYEDLDITSPSSHKNNALIAVGIFVTRRYTHGFMRGELIHTALTSSNPSKVYDTGFPRSYACVSCNVSLMFVPGSKYTSQSASRIRPGHQHSLQDLLHSTNNPRFILLLLWYSTVYR